MIWAWVSFCAGFFGLFLGGELLVFTASRFALRLDISQAIIATTIVAFGSSLPELVISVLAALENKPDLAIGNVIGSNIQNIGLVFAISALTRPFLSNKKTMRKHALAFLGSALLLIILAYDQKIGHLEGAILVVFFFIFFFHALKQQKKLPAEKKPALKLKLQVILLDLIGIILGILILLMAARLTIYGASIIANRFGLSERIIGLTIVAFGTSLPELFICVVAAYRNKADIIIGNIIGSNIYNILAIIGTSACIAPMHIEKRLIYADMPIMIVFTFLFFAIIYTNKIIRRYLGAILLLICIAYNLFLF